MSWATSTKENTFFRTYRYFFTLRYYRSSIYEDIYVISTGLSPMGEDQRTSWELHYYFHRPVCNGRSNLGNYNIIPISTGRSAMGDQTWGITTSSLSPQAGLQWEIKLGELMPAAVAALETSWKDPDWALIPGSFYLERERHSIYGDRILVHIKVRRLYAWY